MGLLCSVHQPSRLTEESAENNNNKSNVLGKNRLFWMLCN